MVMYQQQRRLAEPLRWGRREKTIIAVVLGCVALALVALGASALKGSKAEAADCIRVTFASTLGGADLHGCGPQARRICASGDFHSISKELHVACTRAGFAFKAPA
jgi:hypothetical protein